MDNAEAQAGSPPDNLKVPQELEGKGLMDSAVASDDSVEAQVAPSVIKSPEGLPHFIDETHTYIREFIALADQKAAFLFVASTGMLVYLYGQDALDLWWIAPNDWGLASYAAFFATLGLFLGATFGTLAVWPRLSGNPQSIVFWEAIAKYGSREAYRGHLESLSDRDLVSAKASHVFDIATVCKRKYVWVNAGLWCSSLGFLITVLSIVLGLI